MKHPLSISTAFKLPVLGLLASLVACSSGGGDSVSTATISGAIVAAPVSGAQVSVVDANNIGNTVVDAVTTDASGQYSLSIPAGSLGQDLIISSSGGTYTDEATGIPNVAAGEMFAYVPANALSNGSSVSATPGSTIVAKLVMEHGKSLTDAQTIFKGAFGYTPDVSIEPVDATETPATGVSDEAKLAGLRAAAFSQLAMDLFLETNQQFDMITALAQDLSDGVLDGVDASGPVIIDPVSPASPALPEDVQNRFVMAMEAFHGSPNDKTGLANDKIGNLPFAKVAFTVDDPSSSNPISTYRIEYKQLGSMGAMDGKSTFQIYITNRESGAGVAGLTPMLMPTMHMANDMTHSSPKPVVSIIDNAATDGDGFYTVTLYYLMASQMMNGTSMGYWDLKFTVGGEEAHFYPTVMMSTPGTLQVKLLAEGDVNADFKIDTADLAAGADVIKNMDGTFSAREYRIFKEELRVNAGLYDLSVFIAAKEHMMSFPAVLVPGTLSLDMMGMLTPLTISSVKVEMSDDAGSTWKTATTDGSSGIWTATGLSLTAGAENQVMVKVRVNGLTKVANGNEYQIFTITPGVGM